MPTGSAGGWGDNARAPEAKPCGQLLATGTPQCRFGFSFDNQSWFYSAHPSKRSLPAVNLGDDLSTPEKPGGLSGLAVQGAGVGKALKTLW